MNRNQKVTFVEEQYSRNKIIIFYNPPINKAGDNFKKSHYFEDMDNLEITSDFKNELLEVFSINKIDELKNYINEETSLVFEEGDGPTAFNSTDNCVTVYVKTFSEKVKTNNLIRENKKTVEKLMRKKTVTDNDVLKLLKGINKGIKPVNVESNKSKEIAEEIVNIIAKSNIKLSLKDITDINKERLKDIVSIGRKIIAEDSSICSKLNIKKTDIKLEIAWQRYFELYGSYLLFGSIKESSPEHTIKNEYNHKKTKSRLDILTINKYGFIDIIELKKSSEVLFSYDNSHDNFIPKSALSSAITQLSNYLMDLPRSGTDNKFKEGSESSTGLLIIGTATSLVTKTCKDKYMNVNKISNNEFELLIRKTLRELNYSLSHIKIVLYDELIDNLENFLESMKIE